MSYSYPAYGDDPPAGDPPAGDVAPRRAMAARGWPHAGEDPTAVARREKKYHGTSGLDEYGMPVK